MTLLRCDVCSRFSCACCGKATPCKLQELEHAPQFESKFNDVLDEETIQAVRFARGHGVSKKASSKNDWVDEMEKIDTPTKKYEFWAFLDNKDGASLGIEVSFLDGETLMVDSILPDGLVQAWNDMNIPEKKIYPGDHFIEVNGIKGRASGLLEECKKEQLLRARVWSRKQASNSASTPGEQS
eukprot:gnl/MRDRNA2_/MRDRNA2_105342_c0_seq1.p1 gnl/MRDRNA2_/MRDRNA2_105342_c0~~gnl/MRDRNA2_/MRDRNA2_105342_c0_seq1.p1  ORF type:complete len:196 (-),score=31.17 gnl/MRDRNA2_/MRDRNA2_105342_c0_seq1:465-1013(-)